MREGGGWIDSSKWSAEEERWYAYLVAQCVGGRAADVAPSALLARLNTIPWTECCQMVGNASEDGSYTDTAQTRWTDDRKRRWHAKTGAKKEYLHHRIVQLQPNRPRSGTDVVSHICGRCDCVRLEHIRYQSKREDTLDRAYHKRVKRSAERGIKVCPTRPELR